MTSPRGLTLVELVVSLAILAAIGLASAGLLRAASAAGERRVGSTETVVARAILADRLSSDSMTCPRALAVEQDWGTWPLVGMALSTVLMLPLGVLMFDLVRNLWHTDVNSRNPMASMLLDLFK